jgi:predicted nucleic acid-binding protein
VAYWDTSALLKLYVDETDSSEFWELLLASNEGVWTSTIARTEMFCTLRRKQQLGELQAGGAAALYERFCKDVDKGRLALIGLTEDVHREAERMGPLLSERKPPLLVRSLDLIHLATALAAKSRDLVATDVRLRDVASVAGLRVLPRP